VSPDRRVPSRLTSLVVLAGLLVTGLVVDATRSHGGGTSPKTVLAGVAIPAARPAPTLASTWFCAGGTAVASGFADHVIVMSNPSAQARTATITALTGSIAPPPVVPGQAPAPATGKGTTTTSTTSTTAPGIRPKVATVPLGPWSTVSFRMGGLVSSQLAGAIVEVDGGQIAVEHELTGALGKATAPCSSTTSATWAFPWGVTSRGDRDLMVFMNPFPDDATIDISFATDEGVRDTVRFRGFVVPGRSVVGAYIDEDVTRKDQVSAMVNVRNGHIVVDQIQMFDGTDGRNGITVTLGAPSSAGAWVFPDGLTGPGLTEQMVVFNPTTADVAEVDVDVLLDDPTKNGTPEPFGLTIPPGRYAIVNLQGESRIPAGVGHSSYVRSMNGVPLIAERVVTAAKPAPRSGIGATLGSPVSASTWYFPAGGTSSTRDEFLTLANPSDKNTVRYRVTGLASGQPLAVEGLQDLELAPGTRVSIRVGDHVQRDPLGLVVTATGPIVAERGLYRVGGGGLSQAMGVPLSSDAGPPNLPGG
jgi:hypothetical protein